MTTYSKVYSLLSVEKRRAATALLFLIMLGTILEVLGIGLLLPVIVLLTDENLGQTYPVLRPLLEAIGNPSHEAQVKIIMAVLVGVYLAKNVYLALLEWWQARFTIGLQVDFSRRLFALYLGQPYNFHLQRNSAHLIRNITGEVGQFISHAVNPIISLVAELLILFSVVGLLLSIEPLGSIIVFIIVITASWLFYRGTRRRITRWGQIRHFHDGQRIQHLQQGLGGVKDVKLLGREANFLNLFNEHNSKSGQMAQFIQILQKLPRLWLELLAVIGFALLVVVMLAQGRVMSSIVPTMGLFATAAFRLMPSMSRIITSIQALRYGLPVINALYDEFTLLKPEPEPEPVIGNHAGCSLKKEIRLEGVNYNYTDTPTPALKDVGFTIRQGESIGLIGPSGSGKSTLVDIILGLLKPESGQVFVDGVDIHQNIRAWQDQIGYVPQAIYLTDDTLRRNIAFGLTEDQIDDEAVRRAVSSAQLAEFVASLPEQMETVVGERGVRLSGGQRQRIGIARALYHDPDVLVLDEATSALDTGTESGVMQAVMALHGSKTIIIVAHRLSTVENCDSLCKLEQGRLVGQGTPFELLKAESK